MDIYSNFLTVYESKRIYLTKDELRRHGYDGRLTDFRTACERTVAEKIEIYSSNINVISWRELPTYDVYEVEYYHIHKFDKVYIDSLIYKFYKEKGFKVNNVYMTTGKGVSIEVKLSTDVSSASKIICNVKEKELKEKLARYITMNFDLNVEVRSIDNYDEPLRFNC